MSRGLGATQRAVLSFLEADREHMHASSTVAAAVYGSTPTEGQRRALRQSVRRLTDAGIVSTRRFITSDFEPGGWRFTTEPPLTDQQVADRCGPSAGDLPYSRFYCIDLPAGQVVETDRSYMTADGILVTWVRLRPSPPRWETFVCLA